ncbi:MAG: hypothetical protein JW908_03595 [Anaerolineales bacterium]|nr:hypothetical protein [Anaerolineales bacterium]
MDLKTINRDKLALVVSLTGFALVIVLLVLGTDIARSVDEVREEEPGTFTTAADQSTPSLTGFSEQDDASGIMNISNSVVKTYNCYHPGTTRTYCFQVYNASPDSEWLDRVRLTVPHNPPAWSIACNSQDATDSMGNPVNLTCSNSFSYEVLYVDNDSETPTPIGEISAGSSWEFCVDITIHSSYTGDRPIYWGLSGDDDGDPPHEITDGEIMMEQCTMLRLMPSQVVITGCNGMTQSLVFDLENYSAGSIPSANLTYEAINADFSGPLELDLTSIATLTFPAYFEPNLCIEPGKIITGKLTIEGGGYRDQSFITQTVAENDGWRRRADSGIPTMDNVVVWASHRDGGLWSIGGYGSNGAVQRYDPASDTWQSGFESQVVITPVIEYPMDGCYGLDGANPDTAHEIVVLFPDTIVTDTLHVYDITADQWYTRPIPAFFPGDYIGHWGYDVVSLLNNPTVKPGITDKNMCYLSGGNNIGQGGGTTRNLWRYDPETNGGEYVGVFPNMGVVFGFHASWYVPWIGDDGAICVAGGADHNHQINNTTQCYDLAADTPSSEDLGTLPEPWWGMADGWQATEDGYELWIANGVSQYGSLLPASAYFREGMSDFAYGPPIPYSLYRLEGDGWDGQFFTLNGAQGSFNSSLYSLHLSSCPIWYKIFLPATLRE